MTRLEQHRLDAGLTRKQLAEKAGVAYQTILNAEGGKRPHDTTLMKLAGALGTQPSRLVGTVEG